MVRHNQTCVGRCTRTVVGSCRPLVEVSTPESLSNCLRMQDRKKSCYVCFYTFLMYSLTVCMLCWSSDCTLSTKCSRWDITKGQKSYAESLFSRGGFLCGSAIQCSGARVAVLFEYSSKKSLLIAANDVPHNSS